MGQYTLKDLNEIPHLVLLVQMAQISGMPIGLSIYQEAIDTYPEHFPEEAAHKKKWNAIPKEVIDGYLKEIGEAFAIYREGIPNKGILYWSEHIKEFEEYIESGKSIREKHDKKEKAIYEKWLGKYLDEDGK